jgi:Peptidase A4 family
MGGKLKIAAITAALPLFMVAPVAASAQAANASTPTCGPGGPPYVNGQCISANWAGLLAIGQGPYNHVGAVWYQPAPTSSVIGYHATAIWVGIGGVTKGDGLVQVGTQLADSVFGPAYTLVYQTPATGGQEVTVSGYTIQPGDEMDATVLYQNGGYQMYMVDYTAGWYWDSPVFKGNYPRATEEVILEAPAYDYGNLFYPLVPFSSVQFFSVTIGGLYALQMVRNNRTLVSTSLPSLVTTYHYSS